MASGQAISQAKRLDLAESRAAIADLVHAYARFIRQDMPQEAPELFTSDGVFEIREGAPGKREYSLRSRLEGREHIAVYLGRGTGGPHPCPLIHNLMIEVNGESATGNCVMEARILGTSHAVMGEYHDSFRRVDGRWFFSERIFTIFGQASSV